MDKNNTRFVLQNRQPWGRRIQNKESGQNHHLNSINFGISRLFGHSWYEFCSIWTVGGDHESDFGGISRLQEDFLKQRIRFVRFRRNVFPIEREKYKSCP